jgi:putative spermidine/putrescine transport system ATP-binding protein
MNSGSGDAPGGPTHQSLGANPAVEAPTVPHLRLDRLAKRYGNLPVVADLTLEVRQGELVALLGPSGCGKTTTLRMIGGLIPATSGRIFVDGRDVSDLPSYKRDMGFVFQNYALFPHMTVAQNVAFGLEMRSVGRLEAARRVDEALAMVRLGGFGHRRPRDLSGGQQQRVALARALVIRPSILLLDEPLSNLDAKLRDEMRTEIRDIQQTLSTTTVFVTHDQVEALSMCDRVAVMSRGQLVQVGTPYEIYERPETLFIAEFVGRINTFTGELLPDGRVRVSDLLLRTSSTARPPGPVKVMVRPHRIRLSSSHGPDRHASPSTGQPAGDVNVTTGSIVRTTYVGDLVHFTVDTGALRLQCEQPTAHDRHPLETGHLVTCEWSPADTLVFQESG